MTSLRKATKSKDLHREIRLLPLILHRNEQRRPKIQGPLEIGSSGDMILWKDWILWKRINEVRMGPTIITHVHVPFVHQGLKEEHRETLMHDLTRREKDD